MVYFRLVDAGYGNLKEVKEMTAREVIQALKYEQFKSEFKDCYTELNK